MPKMKKNNRLLRYTSLPVLLDILSKQELTLLNPASWDDRNDSYFLNLYKKSKKLKTILALCFTTKQETYHHWKVFSDGPSGVCIQFKREELLNDIKSMDGVDCDYVTYLRIHQLESYVPKLEELPFLKRRPYKDEGEFRVIYKNKSAVMKNKTVGFDLDCIGKISLSPWIPVSVSNTVKSIIKNINGCSNIRVNRATLVDNKVWKKIAEKEHGNR